MAAGAAVVVLDDAEVVEDVAAVVLVLVLVLLEADIELVVVTAFVMLK